MTDKVANEKTTIYLDAKVKKSVQYYALRDDMSLSQIINDQLFEYLEDMQDLAEIEKRKNEPTIPFKDVLKELGITINDIQDRAKKQRSKTAKKT